MASIDPSQDQAAWNQAYERLVDYLDSFALDDRSQVARLAVSILDRAREVHRAQPEIDPTTTTMKLVQAQVAEWLAANLGEEGVPASQIVVSGSIALMLSGVSRSAPRTFLSSSLPESVRLSMRETLLTTGPDLHVSSMTPRHLDYGPMLDLARQTWHRWDAKALAAAMLFWAGVYAVLYWGITLLL